MGHGGMICKERNKATTQVIKIEQGVRPSFAFLQDTLRYHL
jgi:hypothetical protein